MDERNNLYIARQPICDADGRLLAYELLYRNADALQDRDLATAEVLVTSFLELGLDRLVRDKPAHINLSPAFLDGQLGMPAPPAQVVLELTAEAASSDARIAAVHALAKQGFQLILDDFRYGLEVEPLLELVASVKLDMIGLSPSELQEHAALARASGLTVIAKRVGNYSRFRQARELGCTAFQGFYFAHPELVSGRALPNNELVLLTLLSRLQDPELAVDELERLVIQDVSLAYRLLRHANSAAFALQRRVETVREAILLLGARLVRQWTTLLILSRFGEQRPEPLLDSSLLRGRMCESLARAEGVASADAGFTTGLFSTLDALLGVPIAELVDQISLEPAVRDALVDGAGPLGDLLARTIGYEQGEWPRLPAEDLPRLRTVYEEAVQWCDETRSLLSSDG